jgi:hypothetical protein
MLSLGHQNDNTFCVLQNELPAEAVELQEEARQEKKSQGGYRCVTLVIVL